MVFLANLALISVGFYFIFTTSPYVRYWVDDFCSSALLSNTGFWQTQATLWNTWSGRFSATFSIALFELIDPWVVQVLPVAILAFVLLSLKQFYRTSIILSVLFVILVLVNAPNIIQTFYWQTGSLNYFIPFIFLNVFLGLLVFPPKRINIFVPAVLLLIAGGFSEAYAVAQPLLLAVTLLVIRLINFQKKEEKLKIVIAGLIGAVLAIGLVLLAPGNEVRSANVTHPESLFFVVKSTLLGTKWYLLRMLSVKPFIYSLFMLFTTVLLLGRRIDLKARDLLLLGTASIFSAILITAGVFGSGYYSMASPPPERALFVAIYMILVCFVVFSFSFATLVKPNTKLIWVVVVINLVASFLLIKSMVLHWDSVRSEIQNYAVEFAKVEPALLNDFDKSELAIKNIKPVGGLDSFTDNGGWVGWCLASHYRVKNIKFTP